MPSPLEHEGLLEIDDRLIAELIKATQTVAAQLKALRRFSGTQLVEYPNLSG